MAKINFYNIDNTEKADIFTEIATHLDLYETIVAHRYKFSRVGEVDYNLHHPQTLNPNFPKEVISDWEADYAKMKEDMIYEEKKPGFEDLINNLQDVRIHLQSVEWCFELTFPTVKH